MNLLCGIYRITHLTSGNSYIGCSKNIHARWRDHVRKASADSYMLIGRALAKYGSSAFRFEVIEVCEYEQLSERESFWVSKEIPAYNLTSGGKYNYSLRESSREMISAALKRHWENVDQWSRSAIARRMRSFPGAGRQKGSTVSQAVRMTISQKLRGRKNGPCSESTKRKISTANSRAVIGFSDSGCFGFASATDAASQMRIPYHSIINSTRRNTPSKGIRWMYVDSVHA